MKVSNLITRLKKLDQDKEIFVSCDEEGNSIFAEMDIDMYDLDVNGKMVDDLGNFCIFPNESTRIEPDFSDISDEELDKRIKEYNNG